MTLSEEEAHKAKVLESGSPTRAAQDTPCTLPLPEGDTANAETPSIIMDATENGQTQNDNLDDGINLLD